MEPPLAVYREKNYLRNQTVTLWPDRVAVVTANFSGEGHWERELVGLSPKPSHGRRRPTGWTGGFYLLLLWAVAAKVLSEIPGVYLVSSSWGFFWALPLFFLIFVALGLRKVPYYTFQLPNGFAAFTLMGNWPDGKNLEAFAAQLSAAIAAAHAAAGESRGVPPRSE